MSDLIAVTGATGGLGGRIARRLAQSGARQRLVVRDASRAPQLDDAEVAQAPYEDPAAFAAALDGAGVLMLISAIRDTPTAWPSIRRRSTRPWRRGFPHRLHLVPRSGARVHVHLRPGPLAHRTAHRGDRSRFHLPPRQPLPRLHGGHGRRRRRDPGSGGRRALRPVARDDVAAVAAAVLQDPSAHEGATYDLTGPELLTMADVASVLSEVRDSPVTFQNETLDEAYASRARYDAPDWAVAGVGDVLCGDRGGRPRRGDRPRDEGDRTSAPVPGPGTTGLRHDHSSISVVPVRVGGETEGAAAMGRIVVTESVTLDGVMQAPGRADEDTRGGFRHGGWAGPYADPVMMRVMGAGMAATGVLLFGRRTYEDFFTVVARADRRQPVHRQTGRHPEIRRVPDPGRTAAPGRTPPCSPVRPYRPSRLSRRRPTTTSRCSGSGELVRSAARPRARRPAGAVGPPAGARVRAAAVRRRRATGGVPAGGERADGDGCGDRDVRGGRREALPDLPVPAAGPGPRAGGAAGDHGRARRAAPGAGVDRLVGVRRRPARPVHRHGAAPLGERGADDRRAVHRGQGAPRRLRGPEGPDLDAALEWGRRYALATTLPVEVRPFATEAGG